MRPAHREGLGEQIIRDRQDPQSRRLIVPSSPMTVFRHSLRKGIGASAGRSRLPDLLSRSIWMAAIVFAMPFPALNWSASSRPGRTFATSLSDLRTHPSD